MYNKILKMLLLSVLMLTLISVNACTKADSKTTTPLNSVTNPIKDGTPALGTRQIGNLVVKLFAEPSPPARGYDTLAALITDSTGTPVSDAQISFDLDMINMSHGRNVIAALPAGNGYYSGRVAFVMPGPWRAVVAIKTGSTSGTVRFDFMVGF
jgi:hypothetical protein